MLYDFVSELIVLRPKNLYDQDLEMCVELLDHTLVYILSIVGIVSRGNILMVAAIVRILLCLELWFDASESQSR